MSKERIRHGAQIDFRTFGHGECPQALRRKHHHSGRRMVPLRGNVAPAEFHWQRSQRNSRRFFPEHHEMRLQGFARQGRVVRWRRHIPGDMGEHTRNATWFVSVTVNIVVSLGTKLAQAEEECWIARGLISATLLHICFPCHRAVAYT